MIRPSRLAALGAMCLFFQATRCAPLPPLADLDFIDSAQTPCVGTLRSWVVAGRGRHLFFEINCPQTRANHTDVVEFSNTAFRQDFDWTQDPLGSPRIVRMTAGVRVRPAFGQPDNRLEATYHLTRQQADCLLRDRLFENAYFIVGSNSNSAMRAVCDACSVALPPRVLQGAGVLGEFPGIDHSAGVEIPQNQWRKFGWLSSPGETP